MSITKGLKVAVFPLLFTLCVRAQSNDRIRQTWKGPDVSTLWDLLNDTGAKDTRVDVLKFTPSGDSGVTKALADALGGTQFADYSMRLVLSIEAKNLNFRARVLPLMFQHRLLQAPSAGTFRADEQGHRRDQFGPATTTGDES